MTLTITSSISDRATVNIANGRSTGHVCIAARVEFSIIGT
ncbi:Uncharacterised protein [Mycobacterium tuberculosis]|uniref:Uncharacterized protein n=1 Tax=Mycobacterium tuberculosis TaxID=1773 RepID=A0A916PB59_MYCTX|nr:Uncharacterised protein [Mycobacterium tuberculosis]COX54519.1 Uncharacterised protein [Mycobacterium tuberculosis]COY35544.1 Uncharacterised protein [Mycobacterium tuberculosis]CPA56892.1 Uncharacterised protein [Mycobacterium tuberculosis]